MQYFRKKSELNYKYLYVYCLIKGHKGANQNKTVILFLYTRTLFIYYNVSWN